MTGCQGLLSRGDMIERVTWQQFARCECRPLPLRYPSHKPASSSIPPKIPESFIFLELNYLHHVKHSSS